MRDIELRAYVGEREFVLHRSTPPAAVHAATGTAPRDPSGLRWAVPGGGHRFVIHDYLVEHARKYGLRVELYSSEVSGGMRIN